MICKVPKLYVGLLPWKAYGSCNLKAVHVSQDGTGRKRYVELYPKISYSEFLSIQSFQFTALDKFGETFMNSFKDDLLVEQGEQRDKRETILQGLAFLTTVGILDYASYFL